MSASKSHPFLWHYRARLLRVVDGDTMDFAVDLGFNVSKTIRIRVLYYDAPEMRTDEGQAAKREAIRLLSAEGEWPLVLRTEKDKTDKYGRWLANIGLPDGTWFAHQMAKSGHVKRAG